MWEVYHSYLVVVGVETLDDVDADDDVDAELEVEALIKKCNTPKYMSHFTYIIQKKKN